MRPYVSKLIERSEKECQDITNVARRDLLDFQGKVAEYQDKIEHNEHVRLQSLAALQMDLHGQAEKYGQAMSALEDLKSPT